MRRYHCRFPHIMTQLLGHADAMTLRYDLRLPSPASSGWKRARRPLWGRNSAGRIATRPPQLARLTSRLASAFGPVQLVSRGHYHSCKRLRQQPSLELRQCEPFRHPSSKQRGVCELLAVQIAFPSALKMEWEGKITKSHFFPRRRSTVESPCQLRGHRRYLRERLIPLYSVALVFRSDHPGASADQHRRYSATSLASVAEPAGRLIRRPVQISTEGSAPRPFHEFLRERLKKFDAAADTGHTTVFSVLTKLPDPALGRALREALLGMTFPDPTAPQPEPADARAVAKASLSLEVIGASHHDDFMQATLKARQPSTPISPFTPDSAA